MDSTRIVLKISGELLSATQSARKHVESIATQIASLRQKSCHLSIVIGGGNLFRGDQHGTHFDISPARSHEIGMIATLMNGLLLEDILSRHQIPVTLMSAFSCDQFATPINQTRINKALSDNTMIIFAGGTGNPFVTTDTAAVVRALQVHAHQLWKATKVDGVYDQDPNINTNAQYIPHLSYNDALTQNIEVMDRTALTLAQKHSLTIKVFNMSTHNALVRAYEEKDFGSTIQ